MFSGDLQQYVVPAGPETQIADCFYHAGQPCSAERISTVRAVFSLTNDVSLINLPIQSNTSHRHVKCTLLPNPQTLLACIPTTNASPHRFVLYSRQSRKRSCKMPCGILVFYDGRSSSTPLTPFISCPIHHLHVVQYPLRTRPAHSITDLDRCTDTTCPHAHTTSHHTIDPSIFCISRAHYTHAHSSPWTSGHSFIGRPQHVKGWPPTHRL